MSALKTKACLPKIQSFPNDIIWPVRSLRHTRFDADIFQNVAADEHAGGRYAGYDHHIYLYMFIHCHLSCMV